MLKAAGLAYVREKTFDDLRGGRFRFDFWVTLRDGRNVIIEYNGEQHYQFVSKFYRKNADWMKAREHDRRKISYCLANGIDIYIVPYWELEQVSCADDLMKQEFKAKTRWHNDEVWDKKRRQDI